MPDTFLQQLAYEVLPAVRMRLAQETLPVITFLPADAPGADQLLREGWKDIETIVPAKGGPSEPLVNALVAAMREASGLLMLKETGWLAWGQDRRETEALLRGETVQASELSGGPLSGRIALITGAAQGFGKGLAEYLAKDGACVMVADINEETGKKTVNELKEKTGNPSVAFVKANVMDSHSVNRMVQTTVLAFGGLDIFISNAGILKAGGLEALEEEAFDLVTQVNYKGFYLGTKYASRVMKTQHKHNPEYFMDIIQINSKSGLQGSNRNFAYAGSKFGSIGLVQSFALELVPDKIKVNAVCPGNFFDGPLWSDPENGLFVQYLRAGKVAGAKTIGDVRKHYEGLVPMGRGTTVKDVYRAVRYLIEQEYETGQALPVTGGQVMMR